MPVQRYVPQLYCVAHAGRGGASGARRGLLTGRKHCWLQLGSVAIHVRRSQQSRGARESRITCASGLAVSTRSLSVRYSSEIISRQELLQLLNDIIGRFPDLVVRCPSATAQTCIVYDV